MKRKIKFRGEKIDNGKMIYGQILTNKLGIWIIEDMNPHYCSQYGYIEIDQPKKVIPESVGQYTGLKDKNGKEIYEGDIIKVNGETEKYYENIFEPPETVDFELITEVFYNDLIAGFDLNTIEKDLNMTNWGFFGEGGESHLEIIGNIHENKELIE